MGRGRRISAEGVRASLWFWPVVAAGAFLLLTLVLLKVRPVAGTAWAGLIWPAGADAALALLQTVATAIMAAATVTVSLTVVALQLASQQFSPRLLRQFARDRFTQAVLALFISTFVVALAGLQGLNADQPVPVLVMLLVLLMGIASAVGLLAFVGHIVKSLRVDTMMVTVHEEAASTIKQFCPPYEDRSKDPQDGLPGPAGGTLLPSARSGFVQIIQPRLLITAAAERGLFIRLGIRPGDHVVAGSPLGSIWSTSGAGAAAEDLEGALQESIGMGFERTSEQDVALGLRQLTDIAVKAISPGINDPITAAHAIGYCADLLTRLQGRHLGPQQHNDTDGQPRLLLPARDHRYYLDLVCAPIRRFGRAEPLVLTALLRMLRDCAAAARDGAQREEVSRQAGLILENASDELLEYDREAIVELVQRVEAALEGNIDDAYRDRAGETRSV
ncbi:hypothetical protein NCCP1664_24880 [Zafaria cholistanensis]|uniref:DUF2254 domain-containing protein n=1 Tax=Zafaria cholistanensis TaxID=1682741 RepID=A0A5A7NT81_9MICC|nr:DUF2254 domain-containing protein [Zafaria cholistanensis]GER23993.1 hypothetical protein NCCP1664_24880 [Zafaria cholistanensis]